MKKINAILLALLFLVALPLTSPAGAGADDMTKTKNGIKAALNLDPSKSMVDLYLTDNKTKQTLKEAKVRATVVLPDGSVVEKELMGMMMGPVFSFMNTLDMSLNGRYSFDINVETGNTKAVFKFTADI